MFSKETVTPFAKIYDDSWEVSSWWVPLFRMLHFYCKKFVVLWETDQTLQIQTCLSSSGSCCFYWWHVTMQTQVRFSLFQHCKLKTILLLKIKPIAVRLDCSHQKSFRHFKIIRFSPKWHFSLHILSSYLGFINSQLLHKYFWLVNCFFYLEFAWLLLV